jgi:hypothetical protein
MRERVRKVALLSAMGVTTLNVWTGSPLLALWIGCWARSARVWFFFFFSGSPIDQRTGR